MNLTQLTQGRGGGPATRWLRKNELKEDSLDEGDGLHPR